MANKEKLNRYFVRAEFETYTKAINETEAVRQVEDIFRSGGRPAKARYIVGLSKLEYFPYDGEEEKIIRGGT